MTSRILIPRVGIGKSEVDNKLDFSEQGQLLRVVSVEDDKNIELADCEVMSNTCDLLLRKFGRQDESLHVEPIEEVL